MYQQAKGASRSICDSPRFGFDNGCKCKSACSLVAMQMLYLLGMRRYVPPPRLTIDAFTLLTSHTVCSDGTVDTTFAIAYDGFGVACVLR